MQYIITIANLLRYDYINIVKKIIDNLDTVPNINAYKPNRWWDALTVGLPVASIVDLLKKLKKKKEISQNQYNDITEWLKEKGYVVIDREAVKKRIENLQNEIKELKDLLKEN